MVYDTLVLTIPYIRNWPAFYWLKLLLAWFMMDKLMNTDIILVASRWILVW